MPKRSAKWGGLPNSESRKIGEGKISEEENYQKHEFIKK